MKIRRRNVAAENMLKKKKKMKTVILWHLEEISKLNINVSMYQRKYERQRKLSNVKRRRNEENIENINLI